MRGPDLGERDAARRVDEVGMEQVAEQFDTIDEAGPGREKVAAASTANTVRAPSSAIRSQCSSACARACSTPQPQGIATTTSGSRPESSPQLTSGDLSPGGPAMSSPPAIEIISGTQWPPTNGGSSHSSAITRGELDPATAPRTIASRPSSSARSSRASDCLPVASPRRTTSSSTSASVLGSCWRTRGSLGSRAATFSTSS